MTDEQFKVRAATILANMARERDLPFWKSIFVSRWVTHHEPLRNDAANLLRESLDALQRSGVSVYIPSGERLVGDDPE